MICSISIHTYSHHCILDVTDIVRTRDHWSPSHSCLLNQKVSNFNNKFPACSTPLSPHPKQWKILLLTFKALHGLAPEYLSELLELEAKTSSVTTRNTNAYRLEPKTTRTITYGDRAFSAAAPFLWNKLPKDVRLTTKIEPFKSKIKTYLFNLAYKSSDN